MIVHGNAKLGPAGRYALTQTVWKALHRHGRSRGSAPSQRHRSPRRVAVTRDLRRMDTGADKRSR
jgi:hypothetical protein